MNRFEKEYPRKKIRTHKHKRMRFRITGTPERPRLAVFRSAKHIYAQIIDDVKGVTLVSASTLNVNAEGTKTDAAKLSVKLLLRKRLMPVSPRSYLTVAVTFIMAASKLG